MSTKDNQYDYNGDHFAGYPLYPANEDIYNQYEKDELPEDGDLSALKKPNAVAHGAIKSTTTNNSLRDLDVPGAELDDALEDIGSEDEENNYYSIGGDNHENLEEDNEI